MKEGNKNRKDEILSHHTEVNIDEIWAAIEPQIDIINAEKKRKKRFMIFFLFGAVLLASSGLYMWQNTVTESGVNGTNQEELQSTETIAKEEPKASLNELIQTQQNTDSQHFTKNIKETNNEVNQSQTSSSFVPKSVNSSNTNTVRKVKPAANSSLNGIKNIFSNSNISNQQINIEKDNNSISKVASNESMKPQLKTPITPPKLISLSPKIPTLKSLIPNSIPEIGEPNISEEGDDKLPGGKLNFAIAGNTGISFINRGLGSNIAGESSPEVLKLRRESETLLEAMHYGLRGKLTHKSGFSFSTGAQYTVLSERYDNNSLIVENDSIEGIVKRVIQFNGDTIDMFGMLPRTTTYNYEKQIYNRYKMIDIPFIVGYEGGMDKWSLGIQAGVFVNLALKTSGQIRNSVNDDINIGENQSDVFKDKVGLSYYGGIYIRRELSPYLDITIAPHGRFFAQDFNVDSYDLKQKYGLIGIQAGLSYRFGY